MACITEGSLEGAEYLIIGAILESEGMTRVTMRVIDVETGVVLQGGVGTVQGTGTEAISQAAAIALNQLGL
jgi:uncharacterized protein (DUF39 family)